MKKMVSVLLVAMCMLLLVTGCGEKQQEEKDVNTSELAHKLLDTITFQDVLSLLDVSEVDYLYQLEGMTLAEQTVCVSSTGATAEEIAILKASSAEDAAILKDKVIARIESQKIRYENYVPEELVKLGKPVIKTIGNCVILCVADENEKAEQVICNYLNYLK